MLIILYRWRIKKGMEAQFVAAWSEVTSYIRENCDSLGSRLHLGADGLFYGYAQWKSAEQRQSAFAALPDFEARAQMREAIEETLPEIALENIADYLVLK